MNKITVVEVTEDLAGPNSWLKLCVERDNRVVESYVVVPRDVARTLQQLLTSDPLANKGEKAP